MKLLVVALSMLLGASGVQAQDKEANFDTRKAEMLKHIDERVAKLQEHKSCVSGAADKEALKKCHETMKEHREEWKETREERREKRKERRGKGKPEAEATGP